jgi:hypothetical protein
MAQLPPLVDSSMWSVDAAGSLLIVSGSLLTMSYGVPYHHAIQVRGEPQSLAALEELRGRETGCQCAAPGAQEGALRYAIR